MLYRGIRLLAQRQIGSDDCEDVAQETILTTIKAIQSGAIYNEEAIPAFARTVAQRHIIRIIHERQSSRNEVAAIFHSSVADRLNNPEQAALAIERQALMVSVLKAMSIRDRMVLTRFYLDEETKEQICAEMGLTETQFRLIKSRAKLSMEEKVHSLTGLASLKKRIQGAVA
ncbi:MAG TPA: sigma-70 family RNA polymerase sigma factor [Nitrospiraceae bacterium]|nr:sigma-70 family RNA polymerase sigma factor [Nitrospiraceae bacterium]